MTSTDSFQIENFTFSLLFIIIVVTRRPSPLFCWFVIELVIHLDCTFSLPPKGKKEYLLKIEEGVMTRPLLTVYNKLRTFSSEQLLNFVQPSDLQSNNTALLVIILKTQLNHLVIILKTQLNHW